MGVLWRWKMVQLIATGRNSPGTEVLRCARAVCLLQLRRSVIDCHFWGSQSGLSLPANFQGFQMDLCPKSVKILAQNQNPWFFQWCYTRLLGSWDKIPWDDRPQDFTWAYVLQSEPQKMLSRQWNCNRPIWGSFNRQADDVTVGSGTIASRVDVLFVKAAQGRGFGNMTGRVDMLVVQLKSIGFLV